MPRQPTTLAKLTRPKLFRVIAHDRLFTRLDQELQNHPLVWIAGPPGSRKTALAASYAEARRLPNIRYQVDGGDAEPATFSHHLTIAGQAAAGRKRLGLPVFTPEYGPDLPGFTRRYFGELFAGLPTTTTLVLDNYQEVSADSSFHNVIQGAMIELPPGINLLVISHTPSMSFLRTADMSSRGARIPHQAALRVEKWLLCAEPVKMSSPGITRACGGVSNISLDPHPMVAIRLWPEGPWVRDMTGRWRDEVRLR